MKDLTNTKRSSIPGCDKLIWNFKEKTCKRHSCRCNTEHCNIHYDKADREKKGFLDKLKNIGKG